MISATDLHKWFGDFHAVRGISLQVQPGEVLALLGPNGAGKSTTVRMLTTILRPSRGSATVAGHDVVKEPERVRPKVGLLTEFPGLYARMSGADYLMYFARLQGLSGADATARIRTLLTQFDLWEARDRKVDSYSRGMKQKIALLRSMLHDPQVLFLDEPTTAMDPQSARVVRNAILDLRNARRVIVLCTHNLNEAEALADNIAVIRSGRIVADGSSAELTRTLLGDPVWELKTAASLGRIAMRLQELVPVEEIGSDTLRYRTMQPHVLNPLLLETLHAAGVPVISLSEVPRSLEAVYLRIVEADESVPRHEPRTGERLLEEVAL